LERVAFHSSGAAAAELGERPAPEKLRCRGSLWKSSDGGCPILGKKASVRHQSIDTATAEVI
jgi:hypothetical protein